MSAYDNVKHIKKASDIPSEEHYAIVEDHSVSVQGYDRNDSYCVENYFDYRVYSTREAWEAAIRIAHERKPGSFKAMHVTPATIKVEIKIDAKMPTSPIYRGMEK